MDSELISTRDKPGTYDGLATAKPGEPIFTLQGGDPFAPATVVYWATLARAAGLAEQDEGKATRLLKRAMSAEETAWAMQSYQRGDVFEQAEKRATIEATLTDEAAVMVHAVSRLHNSIAELAATADKLAGAERQPEAEMIRAVIERLRGVSASIDPRPLFRPELAPVQP